jgi:hypothetical protein
MTLCVATSNSRSFTNFCLFCCGIIHAGSAEQVALQRKLIRHKKRAYNVAGKRSKIQASYQVRKFHSFQDETGLSDNPNKDINANAVIFENFCWWLQRCTEVHCNYKGAQAFLRVISRHFGIDTDPFQAWPVSKFRDFKKAFNDSALLIPKITLAFDRKVAAHLLKVLLKKEKHNDEALYASILIYLVTSLRAGSVLLSSSDKDRSLTLKMSNVFEQKATEDSAPSMFIFNNRHKNSKGQPVLTAVPFNDSTPDPKTKCAATLLRSAWRLRRKNKAAQSDSVFINTRSGLPLSTGVANKRIQDILREYFESRDKPAEWSKLYSLKSARKAVASHMLALGCAPQTIAGQLKHKTLNAQMHYICRFYKDKPGLSRALYKDL